MLSRFPLSNVVLFPGAYLPLHIFEPRYRAMVRDVLAGDGMVIEKLALLEKPDAVTRGAVLVERLERLLLEHGSSDGPTH